jgi:hypothetical protein
MSEGLSIIPMVLESGDTMGGFECQMFYATQYVYEMDFM